MNEKIFNLNSKGNALVVTQDDVKKLKNVLKMKANVKDTFLCILGNPPFKAKMEELSKKHKVLNFVVENVDEATADQQNRFISIIKDREFYGYRLPDNVIVVFSVKDKETLKKISPELWHFCVNAI